jgi:hypothetical protein
LNLVEKSVNETDGECGNKKEVETYCLTSGGTRSCGCLSNEVKSKRFTKHGKRHTRSYHIWLCMIQRCQNKNNPNYKDYGARGINVCEKWHKFEGFYEDMGEPEEKMTIHRIDNDKGYFLENCKWATRKEQANAKRTNRILEYNNEKLTVSQWADKLQINSRVILSRLRRKWTVEKALTEKVKDAEKKIFYKGETLTVKEWAIKLNMPTYVIRNRINCFKWSVEKTFNTEYKPKH